MRKPPFMHTDQALSGGNKNGGDILEDLNVRQKGKTILLSQLIKTN